MSPRGALIPLAALVVSLLIAGCRTTPIDLRMTGTQLAVDDPRAGLVLDRYLEIVDARTALQGMARVAVDGPDFRLNRPQRILVERPARLRFEVIGVFDQLAAVLATDGRHFDFYDASTGEIGRGEVTPSLLRELARIDLDVHEVVGLLLATPMPSPGLARANVWLEADGRIALVFAWPEGRVAPGCLDFPLRGLIAPECFVSTDALRSGGEMFFFDVDGKLVEQRSLDPGGVIRYLAVFDDYRPLDVDSVVEFPNRITIRSPAAGSTARFVWKRVMLADELSDRFFELRAPGVANQGG